MFLSLKISVIGFNDLKNFSSYYFRKFVLLSLSILEDDFDLDEMLKLDLNSFILYHVIYYNLWLIILIVLYNNNVIIFIIIFQCYSNVNIFL